MQFQTTNILLNHGAVYIYIRIFTIQITPPESVELKEL